MLRSPAGAIHESPLLFLNEQAIHPEVLQEGNEFRGVDGVFTHPVEVRTAGAIGTSETGDFPVAYFLQRIGQFTFQGIACPDRQGEVNLRMGAMTIRFLEVTEENLTGWNNGGVICLSVRETPLGIRIVVFA